MKEHIRCRQLGLRTTTCSWLLCETHGPSLRRKKYTRWTEAVPRRTARYLTLPSMRQICPRLQWKAYILYTQQADVGQAPTCQTIQPSTQPACFSKCLSLFFQGDGHGLSTDAVSGK